MVTGNVAALELVEKARNWAGLIFLKNSFTDNFLTKVVARTG